MKALKVIGAVIGGLVLLIAVFAAVFIFLGGKKAAQVYEIEARVLVSDAPADAASIARGEHLSKILGCTDCHGERLEGSIMVDAPPFLVTASNLTGGRGGVGDDYELADWDRATRYGVKPDGSSVFFMMPSALYHPMSDEDAADLAAYLDQLAPVDNELPDTKYRPLGKFIVGMGGIDAGMAVSESNRPRTAAAPRGATAAYGGYLTSITCVECHGADLRGGPHANPDYPDGPSLADAAGWDLDVFANSTQNGINSSGELMNPEWMPWTTFRQMTDDEVEAIHLYLQEIFE